MSVHTKTQEIRCRRIAAVDPTLSASRPIVILAYEIIIGVEPQTQWETLGYYERGVSVTQRASHHANMQEVIDDCQNWQEKRKELPFEVDGVVIKANDLEIAKNLGFVGKDLAERLR